MNEQNQNKRQRTDDEVSPSQLLSPDQLLNLSADVSAHRDDLINILRNERDSGMKVKLRTAITCFCDAFYKVSMAYTYALGSENTAKSLENNINSVVDYVRTSRASLDVISTTVQNVASTQDRSYASIVSASNTHDSGKQRKTMILEKGKMLPIRSDSQVIVGPADPSSATLVSSEVTKAKLLEVIKPAELGLRITRVYYTANNSVIVEGDPCNSAILRNCAPLLDAGLEVKDKVKLNPRLIVRDIPTDISSDEIRVALQKQNFPDHTIDDFKVVYLFPVREGKKARSCIIETPPECRKALCTANRVYIGMRSCRCADHISILQCFNCHKYGHIAKECTAKAPLCGFCAGAHSSKDCPSKTALCCANCKSTSGNDTKHAAFDRLKCPLFRAKLTLKSASVNYGS